METRGLVLIASASESARRMLAGVLQLHGYVTREVFNSFECECALQHHPDGAVLVIERSWLEGEAWERWRPLLQELPDLPVVLLASAGEPEEPPAGLRPVAQVQDPFETARVLESVEKALDPARAA